MLRMTRRAKHPPGPAARDVQKRHQQWYLGKSFDTFCPMGPWIVPKEALAGAGLDPQVLDLGTHVNGQRRQGSNTQMMIFDIPNLIHTISKAGPGRSFPHCALLVFRCTRIYPSHPDIPTLDATISKASPDRSIPV